MKIIDFLKDIPRKFFGKSKKGGTVVAKPDPPIKPTPVPPTKGEDK